MRAAYPVSGPAAKNGCGNKSGHRVTDSQKGHCIIEVQDGRRDPRVSRSRPRQAGRPARAPRLRAAGPRRVHRAARGPLAPDRDGGEGAVLRCAGTTRRHAAADRRAAARGSRRACLAPRAEPDARAPLHYASDPRRAQPARGARARAVRSVRGARRGARAGAGRPDPRDRGGPGLRSRRRAADPRAHRANGRSAREDLDGGAAATDQAEQREWSRPIAAPPSLPSPVGSEPVPSPEPAGVSRTASNTSWMLFAVGSPVLSARWIHWWPPAAKSNSPSVCQPSAADWSRTALASLAPWTMY